MLLTVQEFKQRVSTGLFDLTADLAEQTGRGGPDERASWFNSLPVLADLLDGPELAPAHLEFVRRSHSAVDARTNVVGAAVFTSREPVGQETAAEHPTPVTCMKPNSSRPKPPPVAASLVPRNASILESSKPIESCSLED